MRNIRHAILVAAALSALGCEDNNISSKAVDPGGPAAGKVYVVVNREDSDSGGGSGYTIGHSERWIGGKQTGEHPFGESFDRGWWFDLILPDGTYEGCAAIGWDPGEKRVKFLCRSWQNIDLALTTPEGEVVSHEHRPEDLRPLSVATDQAGQAGTAPPATPHGSHSDGSEKFQPEPDGRSR